eukprot:248532_1
MIFHHNDFERPEFDELIGYTDNDMLEQMFWVLYMTIWTLFMAAHVCFCIQKKTYSYKAVSRSMDALFYHNNCITTYSIIVRDMYMDYLQYSEWLKFYHILALTKNKTMVWLIKQPNKIQYSLQSMSMTQKCSSRHVFFLSFITYCHYIMENTLHIACMLKTLLHLLGDFVKIFTFINVVKYTVLQCTKRGIDDKLHFMLQNQ